MVVFFYCSCKILIINFVSLVLTQLGSKDTGAHTNIGKHHRHHNVSSMATYIITATIFEDIVYHIWAAQMVPMKIYYSFVT